MKRLLFIVLVVCCSIISRADDSGSCGEQVTYAFMTSTGTLTISGTGDMSGWDYDVDGTVAPWGTYADKIKEVIVNAGVTNVGDYAFFHCSALTSVTLPRGLASIGEGAFMDCEALVSANIPNSVTIIGDGAFFGCSGLTSVTIPNGVTSIGYSAFYDCSTLTSLAIPNSVTTIGGYAFYGCGGLTAISVGSNNTAYDSRGNCNALIETSTNTLITGCRNTVVPNSVTNIGDCAFQGCSDLSSLTIPNSVTAIGDYAFQGCGGLAEVRLSNSLTTLGNHAFQGCSGLTTITIPSSLTSIGGYAFYDCSGLTAISVESGNTIYDSRGNCNALIESSTNQLITGCQNTVIPNSVTSIAKYAFAYCDALKSVTIPNSVTSIGDGAFFGCKGLKSVAIPNGVTSVAVSTFDGCLGLKSVIIPNSVTSIGAYAFYKCTSLPSITIPNSVTSIGGRAFFGCLALRSVTISSSMTSIGDFAFCNCNLNSVTCLAENVPSTELSAFADSNHGSATLYVPVGSIEAYKTTTPWSGFRYFVKANAISMEKLTVSKGQQAVLQIALDNNQPITDLQFDLYLPEGVSIATNSSGEMMIHTTDRMQGNYTVTGTQMDGFVRILGSSAYGDAFEGSAGNILTLTLNTDRSIATGNHAVLLKNIFLTAKDFTTCCTADAQALLTVSCMVGDVDGSGSVNINDVVCIINYILNKPNGTFIREAADVDGSGSININDVVTLINRYILHKE
jgi:hypothetical protein